MQLHARDDSNIAVAHQFLHQTRHLLQQRIDLRSQFSVQVYAVMSIIW